MPDEAVTRAYEAARSARPDVPLALEAFAEAVAGIDLAHARTDDLYLAIACAKGEPAALAAFDRELTGVIERAVVASGATPAETAELVQIVRVRLLAPKPDAPPAIATFTARSTLASWVKVVATREAARLLAHDRREELADDDAIADHLSAGSDPQLDHLKKVYREEFRAAFAAAVDALTDRDRLLLRQHVLDDLSIDQLAPLHGVHRATAARWVAAARRAVIEGTRKALIARLRIAAGELDSILRLIHSQLDVSLPAALREAGKR